MCPVKHTSPGRVSSEHGTIYTSDCHSVCWCWRRLTGTSVRCSCGGHLLGCLLSENLVGLGLLHNSLDHTLLIG